MRIARLRATAGPVVQLVVTLACSSCVDSPEIRGIRSAAPIHVYPGIPADCPGLQAADYFLWALQRFYERREDRYIEFLWPACHLVHDLDDTRQAIYGVYYTQKKPLTIAAFDGLPGI